jgi:hypothetical protein
VLRSGHCALIALALLACSPSGSDERRDDAGIRSANPPPGTCEQRRRCCAALAGTPGLQSAQRLCQMHVLEDSMSGELARDAGNFEEICRMELVQLQTFWKMHELTDAGAPMPPECRSGPPKPGTTPSPPP